MSRTVGDTRRPVPTPARESRDRRESPRAPDVRAALRECRMWRGASETAIDTLASAARVKEVPRGTPLATEGESADHFGVLVTGKARVFHLGADGRRITFETLAAGDPVAAVAALAG